MINRLLFSLFLFTTGVQVYAQETLNVGAKEQALGGGKTTLQSIWASTANPAIKGQLEETGAAVYVGSRFALKELATKGFTANYRLKNSGLGVHVVQFGYKQFNRTRIGLSYGMKLSESFSAGVGVDYHRTFIAEGYGTRNNIIPYAGIFGAINEKFDLGAYVYNPTRASISDYENEKLPTLLALGGTWHVNNNVQWIAEVNINDQIQSKVRTGVDYKATENFSIRAGLSSDPFESNLGFGLHFEGLNIDFAAGYHPVLGFTPHVGLSYIIDKKQ